MIGGERWSENTFLNMHKSSHGDQRSSTFNLNAGELSWNVLLTLHAFGYRSQSLGRVDWVPTVDAPEITYVRSKKSWDVNFSLDMPTNILFDPGKFVHLTHLS